MSRESSPRVGEPGSPDPPALSATAVYQTLLPPLPTLKMSENSLFLHGDPSAWLFRVEDFAFTLGDITDLQKIKCLCPFQFNPRWMVTFTSEADMEELAARTEITVKGRRCLVINPNRREIAVRLHWVSPKVPDERLIRQFERLGRVQRVIREGWQKSGLTHMTGTTRIFHVIPSTWTSLKAIPHQATLNSFPFLIKVPGRPPLCLRCYHTGHYRKNCPTPWCRAGRAYGNDKTNCTQ
ncbi:hypothetical protein HPB48_015696 [Haemaphysalis longicornis]|uniref:CCHC-type domain-containing protein n=1 Tax=Haemaphysalis longicornis TaxID=44386 RepID=A0A9J6GUN4_HAELO|nr:hypothetical protein HPB48_015696 [Haemaphysalis longicornis]